MESAHRQPITSKFIALYTKLLQGVPPNKVDANGNGQQVFADLLDLKVDSVWLSREFQNLSKDTCLGRLKPFLNQLFASCLRYASDAPDGEAKKDNALETLAIASRYCLSKNLSGWEVMELFAGSVGQSDAVFNDFTSMLNSIIGDDAAPVATRHRAVRLGLAFVCTISQLSPGAYFLRRNLFPSLIKFFKCKDAPYEFILDAALFLAILANYHKSDAAKMNPYLKRMKECEDEEVLQRICRATVPPLDAALRAYGPTSSSQAAGLGAAWNALLRPDRFLTRMISATPKNQVADEAHPIAQAVALLPVYEFLAGNAIFNRVIMRDIEAQSQTPWLTVFVNLASWLFTNASSSSSARTQSYASLVLEMQLVLVENIDTMSVLCARSLQGAKLCQQRLPRLPTPTPGRPTVCEILDCCNLWLRHNLQKRLAVHLHSRCIWIYHRVIWHLHKARTRLDYHWNELWVSVIGLLTFVSTKLDTFVTTGGVGQLVSDTLDFLKAATLLAETYLPTPRAVHELVYELVRNHGCLERQRDVLSSVGGHQDSALQTILEITLHYQEKINSTGSHLKEASDAFRIIGQEIELHGLHQPESARAIEPSLRAEEVLDFARHACGDCLGLA